jgi:hypothetical protein
MGIIGNHDNEIRSSQKAPRQSREKESLLEAPGSRTFPGAQGY